MKLSHHKKKCKYCGIIYWRRHQCLDYINGKNVNLFTNEHSFRDVKTKKCTRCLKKYLLNPITEEYHKNCKITSGSAKW